MTVTSVGLCSRPHFCTPCMRCDLIIVKVIWPKAAWPPRTIRQVAPVSTRVCRPPFCRDQHADRQARRCALPVAADGSWACVRWGRSLTCRVGWLQVLVVGRVRAAVGVRHTGHDRRRREYLSYTIHVHCTALHCTDRQTDSRRCDVMAVSHLPTSCRSRSTSMCYDYLLPAAGGLTQR